MANSVHTARWVSQLKDTGWDIHVFDMLEGGLTPELSGDVTTYTFNRPSESSSNVSKTHHFWLSEQIIHALRSRFPAAARVLIPSRINTLTRLIRRLKPDIIHSLEMQHESYPLLEVRRKLGGKFAMPWIYTIWGSDLYLFGNQPEHHETVKEVLAACDYITTECKRDIALARKYGFSGEIFGLFPGVGGFDIANMQRLMQPRPVSQRRVIAVKGYTGWAGRAIVALNALHLCADMLKGYEIEVYLATPEVKHVARYISKVTGIKVKIIPPSPNKTIIELMGRSRIAIGVNISDGIPNSMMEAMVMGAFPIQSDTGAIDEWITDGENGLLVPPEDPQAIAKAIRRALTDDTLVNKAAAINRKLTMERIDKSIIQPQVIAMYEKVAADKPAKRR